jgi:hypothetical protein
MKKLFYTYIRQAAEAAQARAYQRKHGLVRRGIELRIVYLRGLYRYYLPQLDDPHPLQRNHAGVELAKILREIAKYRRQGIDKARGVC